MIQPKFKFGDKVITKSGDREFTIANINWDGEYYRYCGGGWSSVIREDYLDLDMKTEYQTQKRLYAYLKMKLDSSSPRGVVCPIYSHHEVVFIRNEVFDLPGLERAPDYDIYYGDKNGN